MLNLLNFEMEKSELSFRKNNLLLIIKNGKTELLETSYKLSHYGREFEISCNNTPACFVRGYFYFEIALGNILTLTKNFDWFYKW